MNGTTYRIHAQDLRELLHGCDSGTIQLPDFQRGWIWDEGSIVNLIGSIANAYPIGSIMAIDAGNLELKLGSRCIDGVSDEEKKDKPEILILDGQQRITSLYQAAWRNSVVNAVSIKGKGRVNRWFYIDMNMALNYDKDITDAVISVPKNKIFNKYNNNEFIKINLTDPINEYSSFMFPVNKIFDWEKWQYEFYEFWRKKDPKKHEIFINFKNYVIENFNHYQIPIITLDKKTHSVAVCTVFEKINTRGKGLNSFDLLTAIFAKNGFNLRDDWYGNEGRKGRKQRLEESTGQYGGSVLASVSGLDFLKVITLFHTLNKKNRSNPKVSCSRQSMLDLPLSAFQKYEKIVEKGFVRAAKFLFELNIFESRIVPFQSQILSLAAILASLEEDWENKNYKEKLKQWYWSGVFGELYGSTVDARIVRDFIEVPLWLHGDGEPTTVCEAFFKVNQLDTIRSGFSAVYKGIFALLLSKGARDFKSGDVISDAILEEKFNTLHIFSKNWCSKNDIKNFNSIINKTISSNYILNFIGGNNLSSYLKKNSIENKNISIDEILNSHFIDRVALESNDFEKFYKIRKSKLCRMIEKAMGKKAIVGNVDDGPDFEYDELNSMEFNQEHLQ